MKGKNEIIMQKFSIVDTLSSYAQNMGKRKTYNTSHDNSDGVLNINIDTSPDKVPNVNHDLG